MVTTPQDDAATLAMLKDMCPYHGRIWRAWDDLGRKGNRNGVGAARLLDAPDGAGTMTPHTPGPWTASPPDDEGSTDIHAGAYCVATAHGWCGVNDDGTSKTPANATLIAAAPKMLAALKGLVGEGDAGQLFSVRMKAAQDAIAKAEGR